MILTQVGCTLWILISWCFVVHSFPYKPPSTAASHQGAADPYDPSKELFSISFLSFMHQAAMPFSDVVDSAFLSNMDASSLGAMGVARSSQVRPERMISFFFCALANRVVCRAPSVDFIHHRSPKRPFLGLDRQLPAIPTLLVGMLSPCLAKSISHLTPLHTDALPLAVTSALIMALGIGCFQMIIFLTGAPHILALGGLTESSQMYGSAMAFFKARAFTAPAATAWLVATNVFRGVSKGVFF